MANTTSWNWPNIFNIAQNKVSIKEDNASITSRCRLLMLTEPTELYNELNQGVGLKRYMFRYNQPNVKAEICDRCKMQFDLHEPCVTAENTSFADGLVYSGGDGTPGPNELEMTISVESIYGDTINFDLANL